MLEKVVTLDDAKVMDAKQCMRKFNVLYQYLSHQDTKGTKIVYNSGDIKTVALFGAYEMHRLYCKNLICACKNLKHFYYDEETYQNYVIDHNDDQMKHYRTLAYVKLLFQSMLEKITEAAGKDVDLHFQQFCFMFFELKQFYKASAHSIYYRKMNKFSVF